MELKIDSFDNSYSDYYSVVKEYALNATHILEIGGGRHPTVTQRTGKSYTVVDPDREELERSPQDVIKVNSKIEDFEPDHKFDLILSKMVLEHVEFPDEFHTSIMKNLNDDGRVIHFFACRYSIPALANRLLPERIGDLILKILKNRNLDNNPKYKAYYKRSLGPVNSQLKYFENLGYKVKVYNGYVGHNYFKSIPFLNTLERVFTLIFSFFKLRQFSTLGLIVLTKA